MKTSWKISTDEMNDIISAWVDAEMPINPAGYEDSDERDLILAARDRRFLQIASMPELMARIR